MVPNHAIQFTEVKVVYKIRVRGCIIRNVQGVKLNRFATNIAHADFDY